MLKLRALERHSNTLKIQGNAFSEKGEAVVEEAQVLQETRISERNTSPICCHVNVATSPTLPFNC
jgi:hypothetical protein